MGNTRKRGLKMNKVVGVIELLECYMINKFPKHTFERYSIDTTDGGFVTIYGIKEE